MKGNMFVECVQKHLSDRIICKCYLVVFIIQHYIIVQWTVLTYKPRLYCQFCCGTYLYLYLYSVLLLFQRIYYGLSAIQVVSLIFYFHLNNIYTDYKDCILDRKGPLLLLIFSQNLSKIFPIIICFGKVQQNFLKIFNSPCSLHIRTSRCVFIFRYFHLQTIYSRFQWACIRGNVSKFLYLKWPLALTTTFVRKKLPHVTKIANFLVTLLFPLR